MNTIRTLQILTAQINQAMKLNLQYTRKGSSYSQMSRGLSPQVLNSVDLLSRDLTVVVLAANTIYPSIHLG